MNLTGKQYEILLSMLATALLHLSLFPRLGLDPIALNGLGYLALLGYTVLTFILWVIMGDKTFTFDFSNAAVGYYAKAAELFLMGFLLADRPR